MEKANMTIDELLIVAPTVIKEMANEFFQRGDECMKANPTSQETACFLLALRSVSLALWYGASAKA
jgi:hypothetical protein